MKMKMRLLNAKNKGRTDCYHLWQQFHMIVHDTHEHFLIFQNDLWH